MNSSQQFHLKWNNHRSIVFQEFESLFQKKSLVDCTIGAEGKYLKVHKIVLSACSPYFQTVFDEHFDKHPVILLKDVSFKELKYMVEYIYSGEINIAESELSSFLRTAESLKLKGLAKEQNSSTDNNSDDESSESNFILNDDSNSNPLETNVEILSDRIESPKKSNNENFSQNRQSKSINESIKRIIKIDQTRTSNNSIQIDNDSIEANEENMSGMSLVDDDDVIHVMEGNSMVTTDVEQETFNSRGDLKPHEKSADSQNPNSANVFVRYKNSGNGEIPIIAFRKCFQCSRCSAYYKDSQSLAHHVANNCPAQRNEQTFHNCQFCSFKSKWKSNLRRHQLLVHKHKNSNTRCRKS